MALMLERGTLKGNNRALPGAALAIAIAAAAVMATHLRATPLAAARCDFDNDGFEDLALGVPGENVGGVSNAGAVNVIYGSGSGLTAVGNQLWHQDRPAILGTAEAGDAFGATVACGNFNLDAYDDLAIGVPGEDVTGAVDAGAVNVLYGSSTGLSAAGNDLWHQDVGSVEGGAERGDRFGAALATGAFDDGTTDDLAIGVPGEDVDSATNAGAVNVLYGGSGGLSDAGNRIWHQDSPSVINPAGADEMFGSALAAGDFDNDGFDDLAIGVPGQDFPDGNGGTAADAGAVNVLNGSSAGLAADRDQIWSQVGLAGAQESGDDFGYALVSGDFNDDGFDDLAVGVPGEDLGDEASAGAVNVIYGSRTLLDAADNAVWHQDSPSVAGGAEEADAFGAALAADDFNGDGVDDLAVGVPSEDVGDVKNAGAVTVLFGSGAGVSGIASQIVHQDSLLVEGVAQSGDAFGSSVAAGDFDGDRFGDLVSGVPGEALDGIPSVGVANVLYGIPGLGPSGLRDHVWHQAVAGILGGIEPYDRLGGQPVTSNGLYRIPFQTWTLVSVTNDHFSHSSDLNEIDMHGEPNDDGQEYTIVAAARGTIVAMDDSNAEPTGSNNYVWVAHPNGEWTKYTHVATGSVTARGLSVGSQVNAGTALGTEGDVGQASGVHLHFEVAVPDDPDNPIDNAGFIIGLPRVPLFCSVPGNIIYDGGLYLALPC